MNELPVLLDYLDYQSNRHFSFNSVNNRFKFDILAFWNRQLLVSAPALAKENNTLYLMIMYEELWKANRLKYIISPQYGGDFSKYLQNRLCKLEINIPEEILNENYEYVGYTASHWKLFFQEFQFQINLE